MFAAVAAYLLYDEGMFSVLNYVGAAMMLAGVLLPLVHEEARVSVLDAGHVLPILMSHKEKSSPISQGSSAGHNELAPFGHYLSIGHSGHMNVNGSSNNNCLPSPNPSVLPVSKQQGAVSVVGGAHVDSRGMRRRTQESSSSPLVKSGNNELMIAQMIVKAGEEEHESV